MLLAIISCANVALAQDGAEPTVSVTVSGVSDELLVNVQGFLPLFRFHEKPAPSEGRLWFLFAQSDEAINQALAPFGYYRSSTKSTLERVDNIWQANYEIDTGDPIMLTMVDISVTGEAQTDEEYRKVIEQSSLELGTPLLHESYESLKREFQLLASQRGYFDSVLKTSKIQVDLKKYEAGVELHFDSGDRYYLGAVSFFQDKPWLSDTMLGKFSDIKLGQPYLTGDLQQLQGDLSNTEYYREVTLDVSPENANEDRLIPVNVNLLARNPTRYTFGAGFGTDTGARVKAGITRRRVNELGHHFTAEVLLAELRVGVAGEYTIPGSDPRTDAWGFRASFLDENTDTSDFTSSSIGGFYRLRDGLWIKTYSLDYLVERFTVLDEEDTSELLIPSAEWTRTYPFQADQRVAPDFGTQITLSIRGAAESVLSDTNFLQPMVTGKWIYSFDNSTRLIARGAAGTTTVSDFDQLPTSIRFFSGGDNTVRGFDYNTIGPVEEGEVVGGRHLLESSLEYEVPFAEQWSAAGFTDVGDAFDDSPDYKTGVGLGVRWRSPIGPVRFDVAHALDRPPGNRWRLHLTIGSDL